VVYEIFVMSTPSSTIIVTWNSGAHIKGCLAALSDFQETEIIVIDNNSHDSTVSSVQTYPHIFLLQNKENEGFTRAVNQGIQIAQGQFLLILNPDVQITANTVQALIAHMGENPRVGVIAPKLLYPNGKLQYSCRRFPTLATFLLRGLGLTEDRPWMPPLLHRHLMTDYDHRETRDVDWVLGACMLVRRELIEDIGLFDERYFLYYSDIDFCFRAKKMGWRVHYEPRVTAIHAYGRTSARSIMSPAQRSHIADALLFFWRRWIHAI
jgi:GT2 family glycosyltransferase